MRERAGSSAATGPATMPPRMLMKASREFASTSSPLFLITPGTSALLVTLCAFDSTSAPNASGYSASRCTCAAMTRHSTARAAIVAANIRRRPPRVRSSSGPNTGATTRERRERQQEVEQDLRARLARRRAEEQRVGERDRDEHVARDADGVRERQPRERRERRRLEPGPCVRDHNLPVRPLADPALSGRR